jgi:hypothetical protein
MAPSGIRPIRRPTSVRSCIAGVLLGACADDGAPDAQAPTSCAPLGGSPGANQAAVYPSRNVFEPVDCTATTAVSFDPEDECACAERSCSMGDTCVRVDQFAMSAIGGPDSDYNGCFALCQSDADCAAPAICVRNVYGLDVCDTTCRTDSDCNADPCGRCVQGVIYGHGAIWLDPSSSWCGYSGPCEPSSCGGCNNWNDGHQCPP